MEQPPHHESMIYKTCLELFDLYYEGKPMRTVHIGLTNLSDSSLYQTSLFEDEEALQKEYQLQSAIDGIKAKFGKNAITRLSSELEHATGKMRNKQIGGHHV